MRGRRIGVDDRKGKKTKGRLEEEEEEEGKVRGAEQGLEDGRGRE